MGQVFNDRVYGLSENIEMPGNILGEQKKKKKPSALIVRSQRERCLRELRQQ